METRFSILVQCRVICEKLQTKVTPLNKADFESSETDQASTLPVFCPICKPYASRWFLPHAMPHCCNPVTVFLCDSFCTYKRVNKVKRKLFAHTRYCRNTSVRIPFWRCALSCNTNIFRPYRSHCCLWFEGYAHLDTLRCSRSHQDHKRLLKKCRACKRTRPLHLIQKDSRVRRTAKEAGDIASWEGPTATLPCTGGVRTRPGWGGSYLYGSG